MVMETKRFTQGDTINIKKGPSLSRSSHLDENWEICIHNFKWLIWKIAHPSKGQHNTLLSSPLDPNELSCGYHRFNIRVNHLRYAYQREFSPGSQCPCHRSRLHRSPRSLNLPNLSPAYKSSQPPSPPAPNYMPAPLSLRLCRLLYVFKFGTTAGLAVAIPTSNKTDTSRGATTARAGIII